jgi:hypothetical protein
MVEGPSPRVVLWRDRRWRRRGEPVEEFLPSEAGLAQHFCRQTSGVGALAVVLAAEQPDQLEEAVNVDISPVPWRRSARIIKLRAATALCLETGGPPV